MPADHLIPDLAAQGLLTPAQADALNHYERTRPFSVHYELRAMLYFGITLLAGGLGVLVYQNIEHIGHGVIVGFITLVMLACFAYAARHRQPFTWGEAARPGLLPDYLLLLGCLTFLILEGYLQYQYSFFGTRYGLVTILPAVLFGYVAYASDHRGVLAMAITALAAWVGVNVAPLSAFTDADFFHRSLGTAGLALGVGLMSAGLLSEFLRRKAHFAFTYLSLGSNVALLAATAMMFAGDEDQALSPLPAALLILVLSGFLGWYARRTHSYLFLLLGICYSYVVLTYGFFQLLDDSNANEGTVFLVLFYFSASALGVVLLFVNLKKILGIHGN